MIRTKQSKLHEQGPLYVLQNEGLHLLLKKLQAKNLRKRVFCYLFTVTWHGRGMVNSKPTGTSLHILVQIWQT